MTVRRAILPGRVRAVAAVAALALAVPVPVAAQQVSSARGAVVRALDKITGETTDLTLDRGVTVPYGQLRIVLGDCRYPSGNPNSDAFALMEIRDTGRADPVFRGWMVASSPALHALDHPRYDVWVLRCNRS